MGNKFFKDNEVKKLHTALYAYEGDIRFPLRSENLADDVKNILNGIAGTKPDIEKLHDYYDSLLPKTGGGLWNELIVFFYLLRRTSVFVIPLLLTQRIHCKNGALKPPDYLVIDRDKQFYEIEVGGGKESQSSDFASKTGSRMLTTENENIPPRCPICGEWILFLPKVISDCCNIDSNPLLRIDKEVRCAHECSIYSTDEVIEGKCPFTQYHGIVDEKTTERSKQKINFKSKYHYHYSCIKNIKDHLALKIVNDQHTSWKRNKIEINGLVTNYPAVRGIKNLEQLQKNEIIAMAGTTLTPIKKM